jgi:hypothetical protein
MDRLGPAWRAGSGPVGPGQRAAVAGRNVPQRRGPQYRSRPPRSDAPLDDLFSPAKSSGAGGVPDVHREYPSADAGTCE